MKSAIIRKSFAGLTCFLLCNLFLSACSTVPTSSNSSLTQEDRVPVVSSSGAPSEFDQKKSNPTEAASTEDLVQPGYLWEVSSLSDRGINGSFRVEFDGKLYLHYDVTLDTSKMTVQETPSKIIEAYRPFLKSIDSVRARLSQRKIWVEVRGLIAKPGRYLVSLDSSLDEIIAAGGGIPPTSNAEYVRIQTHDQVKAINLNDYYNTGSANNIPRWTGGTLLFFQRKSELPDNLTRSSFPVVQLLGEVKTPGELSFHSDADFLYYLTKAGGPTSVADLSKIEVIRTRNGVRESTEYNWKESHQITKLEPDDLILVHSNVQSPFERFIQSLAGVGSILSAIGVLIIAL